jgi:hypothetical protein
MEQVVRQIVIENEQNIVFVGFDLIVDRLRLDDKRSFLIDSIDSNLFAFSINHDLLFFFRSNRFA